ncbi:MAG: hypothetical protein AB7F99_14965, partial [Vicinamibacterales bacterium]
CTSSGMSYKVPMLRRLLSLGVAPLLLWSSVSVSAQSSGGSPVPASRLRVFLDCADCFEEYLRDEIEWADFVRQPQDADVHLLSRTTDTGGGGEETILRFVGMLRFQGIEQELRVLSVANEAESMRRESILRTVTIGLLNYAARAGLPAGLEIDVEVPEAGQGVIAPDDDPWNLWVFELEVDGSIEAEESTREIEWRAGMSGDRVTENWKIALGFSVEQETQKFDLDENDPFEVEQREREAEWFLAKSVGPHWSFGVEGSAVSSTFDNTELRIAAAPAVEFSVFPYEEYATRQFVFQYEAGVQRSDYYEITLFNQLTETRWQHRTSARFDQRQPWGSLSAGIEWSQYLHDPDLYRLEADGELSLNITRGLALELEGSASRIRDQISLPRRDATAEEVLLRLRALRSGYDVSLSAGVSFTFGSLFNNVVNPRFGTGDDEDDDFD